MRPGLFLRCPFGRLSHELFQNSFVRYMVSDSGNHTPRCSLRVSPPDFVYSPLFLFRFYVCTSSPLLITFALWTYQSLFLIQYINRKKSSWLEIWTLHFVLLSTINRYPTIFINCNNWNEFARPDYILTKYSFQRSILI